MSSFDKSDPASAGALLRHQLVMPISELPLSVRIQPKSALSSLREGHSAQKPACPSRKLQNSIDRNPSPATPSPQAR
jgi:hypothetical protein